MGLDGQVGSLLASVAVNGYRIVAEVCESLIAVIFEQAMGLFTCVDNGPGVMTYR